MAERLNITIDNELFKRLQTVKDCFNISAVCQKALKQEVALNELRKKELEENDMDKIIERLRLEKEQYDKTYRDDGYKDGLDDAKTMSYEELIEVVTSNHEIWDTSVWSNWLEDRIKELESDDSAFGQDAYLEGWKEGVSEFWENIKGSL